MLTRCFCRHEKSAENVWAESKSRRVACSIQTASANASQRWWPGRKWRRRRWRWRYRFGGDREEAGQVSAHRFPLHHLGSYSLPSNHSSAKNALRQKSLLLLSRRHRIDLFAQKDERAGEVCAKAKPKQHKNDQVVHEAVLVESRAARVAFESDERFGRLEER